MEIDEKRYIPGLRSDENFERIDPSRRSPGFVRPVRLSTSRLLYSRTFKFAISYLGLPYTR